MDADESLITAEIQGHVNRDAPPREVTITPELVRRVLETVEEDDSRWTGGTAPPYILLAFETSLPLPEPAAAPASLVTGDEWTLHRPLGVGERLTMVGRLASAHERFGGRFGHTLVLRSTWTFTDAAGAVAAEVGRSMIRYRPPARVEELGSDAGEADPAPAPAVAPSAGEPPHATEPSAGAASPHLRRPSAGSRRALTEGEPLPPLVLRPTLGQVVRYCGLTWNFTPIFFDPEEARRAGLPGTIVPGPLKQALLTRYLAAWAGREGAVHAIRCAHRRPDRTGRPLTVRGTVSHVAEEGDERRVDCEVWTENLLGERSVIASASLLFGAAYAPDEPPRRRRGAEGDRRLEVED